MRQRLTDTGSKRLAVASRLTAAVLIVMAVLQLLQRQTSGDLERDGWQVTCGNAFSGNSDGFVCGMHRGFGIAAAIVLTLAAVAVLGADHWRRRRRRRRVEASA